MSLSLQSALGALLLKVNPKNEAGSPGKVSLRDSWSMVLDHLPANAFDPTQPIEAGGEPWLFLLLKDMGGYTNPALDFMVERYGNAILACRNRAGQNPLERLFASCVRINEEKVGKGTMPTQTLAQLMRLCPMDLLRTPEDRGDAPGSGWLERLTRLSANNANEHGELIKHPEYVLIKRGANPNHLNAEGQPVATQLIHDFQVQAFLEGGLDVNLPAHHPLFPGATVADMLRGKSEKVDDLLGPATTMATDVLSEADPVTPEEHPLIKRLMYPGYGRQKISKDSALTILDGLEPWEAQETQQGTPVVWKAITASDAVLTELKKPKQATQLAAAIQRTDSKGRSPWFHYLFEMDGRAHQNINNESNLDHVVSLMPPLDDSVVVNGQGLYEQAIRHTWSMGKKAAGLSSLTPHPGRAGHGRFGEGGTAASPLDEPLMGATHEMWWGTPEAQQQFARDLLVHLAKTVVKDPLQGKVELPNLEEVLGDPNALHPELVGVIGVVNFVNRTSKSWGTLDSPVLPFNNTRWANYDKPLAVTQPEVMAILRPLVAKRIEENRLSVKGGNYQMKDSQRKEADRKAEISRANWEKTTITWRDYSTKCLAVGPQDAPVRQRVRLRS